MRATKTELNMIEAFQCPGCVCGSDTKCPSFKFFKDEREGFYRCDAHVAGTFSFPTIGVFVPGLCGLCRLGAVSKAPKMRLWPKGKNPGWEKFNVAVWALEKEGYLFVRTYLPGINYPLVDVIEAGTLALCPGAVDVSRFHDEIRLMSARP